MLTLLLCQTGCAGLRTGTLAPAGTEAEATARLLVVMVIGAALVWSAVIGLALHALWRRGPALSAEAGRRLILIGGLVVPTVVLGALLVRGLAMMPPLREPGTRAGARIEVSGEQYWWRVRYAGFEGVAPVTLANEVWLPVGERTRFELTSPDVIHAFWVPELGGKLDVIPGRRNTLVLEPTRTGVFAGACAEFCGTSHARMRFTAVVVTRAEFAAWLSRQAAPARVPDTAPTRRGHDAFLRHGCAACHAVRGTPARGTTGPDLTHVGSRRLLAAGAAANDVDGFRRWIGATHALKPDATMPPFGHLPDAELDAIARWLEHLQ